MLSGIALLTVSLAAEITDEEIKRKEGLETSARFERLFRPLGQLVLSPTYELPLSDPAVRSAFDRYAEQIRELSAFEIGLLPGEVRRAQAVVARDPVLGDVMECPFETHVFFVKRVGGRSPPWDKAEIALSFGIYDTAKSRLSKSARRPAVSRPWRDVIGQRTLEMERDTVLVRESEFPNAPEDRYSNGDVIAFTDLAGSDLILRTCPLQCNSKGMRASLVSLRLEFPGAQAMTLPNRKDTFHALDPGSMPDSRCALVVYHFPDTYEALRRLLDHN